MNVIQSHLAQGAKDQLFNGAVFGFSRGGKLQALEAFGTHLPEDHAEKRAIHIGDVFDLASLTKPLGLLLACLLQARKVNPFFESFDAFILSHPPVAQALEKDPLLKPHFSSQNLLKHSAGWNAWAPLYAMGPRPPSRDDLLAWVVVHLKALTNSNFTFEYSDLGIIVFTLLFEEWVGMRLDLFLDQEIFAPLRLQKIGYNACFFTNLSEIVPSALENSIEQKMVSAYDFLPFSSLNPSFQVSKISWRNRFLQGEVNDGNCFHAMEGVSGHAGLFANLETLMTLAPLFFQGSSLLKENPVRPELLDQSPNHPRCIWAPSAGLKNSPLSMDGSGARIMRDYPHAFAHLGFTGSAIWMEPQDQQIAIFLSNRLQRANPNPPPLKNFLTELLSKVLQK